MNNSCAIAENNDAYCWGIAFNYQNGDGTNTTRSTPTLVPGGYKFSSLALNGTNTGATCGMLTNGRIYCWGAGTTAFTGTGGGSNTTTPTEISGGSQVYSALSGNGASACGILPDGSLRCWGQSISLADHSVFRSWYKPIDVTNWLRP